MQRKHLLSRCHRNTHSERKREIEGEIERLRLRWTREGRMVEVREGHRRQTDMTPMDRSRYNDRETT